MLCLVECTNAPTTFLRVVAGSIEQMVAQHTQKDASCEIYMERLNVERMRIYEFRVKHLFLNP